MQVVRNQQIVKAQFEALVDARAKTRTDTGMAYAFLACYGMDYRYFHDAGVWYRWESGHWKKDDGEIIERISDIAEMMREEALLDNNKAKQRFAERCMDSRGLAAVEKRARTLPGFKTYSTKFESNHSLFCCTNGTYNLDTNVWDINRPENYLIHQSPVPYVEDATCPKFVKFLTEIAGSEQLAGYVLRAMAYTLSGHTDEQCMFILHGTGKNGKSALFEIIRGIMGPYGAGLVASSLLQDVRGTTREPTEIAKLQFSRYVETQETEITSRFAEGLIKSITGGESITARELYRKSFQFKPKFKMWLATNHKPDIHGTDLGIWRRIRLIPFNYEVPDSKVDTRIAARILADEAPGILRLLIESYKTYRLRGLDEPLLITRATQEYQTEMDPVTPFVDEQCVKGEDLSCSLKQMYQHYRTFSEAEGLRPMTQRRFTQVMDEKGYERQRTAHGIEYMGLDLKEHYYDSISGKYKPPS